MRSRSRVAVAAAALALAAVSCGGEGTRAAVDDDRLHVVATTSILGDVVANVAGDVADVEVLMKAGIDPHAYAPSAADARTLREADLVVANGLDFEERLLDVLAAAEDDGVGLLRVAEEVDPIPYPGAAGHGDDHTGEHAGEDPADGDDGHGHGPLDPHFWWDMVRMADAVEVIGRRLAEVAPEHATRIRSSAERYREQVLATHADVERLLSAVPQDKRRVVTNHDALGYFAQRYGFEVVGVIVPGGSTLAAPSSGELSRLAATIGDEDVPAIFAETTDSGRLAGMLKAEVGGDVAVVELHTDSLGERGSGAETYLQMMLTNAGRIADALRD